MDQRWECRDIDEWTFPVFGALFLYGVAVYFLAALVLSTTASDGTDFETIRRPFYGTTLVILGMEVLDTIIKGGVDRLFEFGPLYLACSGSGLLGAIGGMVVKDRRYHWASSLFTTFAMLGLILSQFNTL